MNDLVRIHADIVRCYGSDSGEWDSDFTLGCTGDEIVAYALEFHGLAPDFRTALDWVHRFGGWSVDDSFGDEYWEEMGKLSYDVQCHVFASSVIAIYSMAWSEADGDPVHWSYGLVGDWQTEGAGTSAHNEENQLCEIGSLPHALAGVAFDADWETNDVSIERDAWVSICSHTEDDSRKWVILYNSLGYGLHEVEGMIPTERVGEVSEVLWGLVQMARPWFESRRGFVDRGMSVPDSVMGGLSKSYDDLREYVREVTS